MTRSWCQEPYSAKDSRAFQAAGCSRAKTDWVMVCSSTFSAMAVIHSAKRWKPRQVKAQAKVLSKACQMDQVSLASVMTRLLRWGGWVCPHLASSDQETLLFNTVRLFSYCTVFRGNYCLGDRQELIYLPLGDSRFDSDVVLGQSLRSFQSSLNLFHFFGGNPNAVGILAVEAFHGRVVTPPGHPQRIAESPSGSSGSHRSISSPGPTSSVRSDCTRCGSEVDP